MTNSDINKTFIDKIDKRVVNTALNAIAVHYGITVEEVKVELTDPEAEHILDYLTEPTRSATHVIMQRHGALFNS